MQALFSTRCSILSTVVQFQPREQHVPAAHPGPPGVPDSEAGGGGGETQQAPAAVRAQTPQRKEKSM